MSIQWGERSRDVLAGSTPLSARITFTRPGASTPDVSYIANRRADPAAYRETYATPSPIPIGAKNVTIEFYAQSDGTGDSLGSARFDAVVRARGDLVDVLGGAIPDVYLNSRFASIELQAPSTIEVNGTIQLNAVVRDVEGRIIALAPGAIFFTARMASGGLGAPILSLSRDGVARGGRPGEALLQATVNGISSPEVPISVVLGPNSGLVVIPVATTSLVFSPARDQIYVATSATDAAQANAVLSYRADTGALADVYRLGGTLGPLAASSDGSVLYVGSRSTNAVIRIDATTGSVGRPIAIPPGDFGTALYAEDITVAPDDPNEFVISKAREGVVPRYEDLGLYRDGVEISDPDTFATANAVEFGADGSTLFTFDRADSDSFLQRITVDENGLTSAGFRANALSTDADFRFANGRLFFSNGTVVDAASLTTIGTLTLDRSTEAFAVDPEARIVYYVTSDSFGVSFKVEAYDTGSLALVGTTTVTNVNDVPLQAVRLGPDRLAVRTDRNVYLIDLTKF